jgi:hypothetical protein
MNTVREVIRFILSPYGLVARPVASRNVLKLLPFFYQTLQKLEINKLISGGD